MAGISNYLADKINDWLHGNSGGWSPPATTYFALMTAMPTASGGGTEVSGGSYARLSWANTSVNWYASSAGVKANALALTWATPTAGWGTVVGVAEYDAATGGNLLTFATLATASLVLSGQVFSLPAGAAAFTWGGGISNYLADKLNDWLHGAGTYTVPTTTYFGLMSSSPSPSTSGVETSGSGYSRFADTNNTTHWPASSGQTKSNTNAVTWGPATAAWSGPEVGVAEYDAATGGNLLTFGSLSTPVTISTGSAPQVPVAGAVYQVQ